LQIEHPSAEIVHSRALEVFGNPSKADIWLHRQRKIFNGRFPQQIIASNDIALMREVLRALMAIEFGTFS